MKQDVFNGWVVLRDPQSVSEKHRRPVFEKSAEGMGFTEEASPEAVRFFNEFNDLLAVALVEEWSFDAPITVEGLLELPGRTYDDVRRLVTPFLGELIPDFGVDPDPKATTGS